MMHGLLNVGATALYSASLWLRRRGDRRAGRDLAYLGYAVSLSWAYLGGHLVFDEQIGVDHTSDKVKLKSRREIAEGTMAFHFEKPPGFAFKAGQALAWTLLDPPETDDESRMRNFSIASAPGEPDLMIATRMRDTAFKRVLKTMPLGTEVRIVGPFGSLILHQNADRPAVFLAGGIGITPFRSMLRQAAEQKLPHHIFLFYSNRRPEDAAFLEELEELEKENSNYKFIC